MQENGFSINENLNFLNSFKETIGKRIKEGITPKLNTSIMMDNYYYTGDSTYLYPKDVLYSSLRVSTKLSSLGIPVNLMGNVMMLNGRFNRDFSTFSFTFDKNSVLKNIGKGFMSTRNIGQSDMKQLKEIVGVSQLEEELIKEEVLESILQKIVTHPRYRAIKDSLNSEKSNLKKNVKDSLNENSLIAEKQLESVQIQLDRFKTIEGKYHKLWEKKDKRLKQLKGLKERLSEYEEKISTYSNPDKLQQELLNNKSKFNRLRFKEKLAVILKGAGVGLVTFNDREYTFNNLSILGGMLEYEGKNVFSSIGYGKHNLGRGLTIFSDRFFVNRYEGNRFLYAKVGVGKLSQDYIQVSYLKSSRSANTKVGFLVPANNVVIATALRQEISKGSAVVTDIAISKQDVVPVDVRSLSNRTINENLAFSMKAELRLVQNSLILKLGYFQVGPTFYTSGNPFLLINRKGLLSEVNTSFFQKRVQVSGRLNYATARVSTISNLAPFRRFDFSTKVKVRISKNHNVTFRYAPTTNYRSLGESSISNYFYMFQENSIFSLPRENKLISVISLTNLQSRFDNTDTLFSLGNSYFLAQESLVFGKRSLTLSSMLSSDNYFKTTTDYQFQIDYKESFPKFSYSVGGNVEKRRWDNVQRIGLVTSCSYRFLKKISIRVQTTIKQSMAAALGQQANFIGQVSLLGNF